MGAKRTLIIAVTLTFCLTSLLFMIKPTRSNPGLGEYDPWIDLNDDGIIDIFDAITFANAFNTAGTPINKTDLLFQLLDKIDSLNDTIVELRWILITVIEPHSVVKLGIAEFFFILFI